MLLINPHIVILQGTGSQVTPGFPHSQIRLQVASPKVQEHSRTTPMAYELASDTYYGLGVVTTHLSPTSRCLVQTFKSVSLILTDSALSQAVEDVVLIGDKTTQSVAMVPKAIGLSYINTMRSTIVDLKAIKNAMGIEGEGCCMSHIRDGEVLVRYFTWKLN